MLATRIIPVFLLKNGFLVRPTKFNNHLIVGDPILQFKRLNQWDIDEIIYLDISDKSEYSDIKAKKILKQLAAYSNCPLTFGGNIKSLDNIAERIELGAEKISINTICHQTPEFITQASLEFGSQAIITIIDIKYNKNNIPEVYSNKACHNTHKNPIDWAKHVEQLGTGEILLNFIDNDGTKFIPNCEIINEISNAVKTPVLALGGANTAQDLADFITKGSAHAACAGNMFLFKELSYPQIKHEISQLNLNFNIRFEKNIYAE